MTVYLLDVNVLIPLHDPLHPHAEAARQWFGRIEHEGWATCPMTESGFIRISSNPRFPGPNGDPTYFASLLADSCVSRSHHFWPDDLSAVRLFSAYAGVRWDDITDLYLLALAVERGGKFATFDKGIPAHLLPGGVDALEVISR